MSKSKFTPGPWKRIKKGMETILPENANPESIPIAIIFSMEGINQKKAKANARLIAKAPEMYDLLKELSEHPTIKNGPRGIEDIIELLEKIDGKL